MDDEQGKDKSWQDKGATGSRKADLGTGTQPVLEGIVILLTSQIRTLRILSTVPEFSIKELSLYNFT